MKKSTKGALAAGAAAALLLGGAGTLAYWTADATVDGGTLNAGNITLEAADCESFVHTDGSPVTLIVPGDTVTADCDVTLTLEGDNIGAELTIEEASFASTEFGDELSVGVALVDGADAAIPAEFEGADTYEVTARITAVFPYGTEVNNDSKGATAVLEELQLVAVQTNTLN